MHADLASSELRTVSPGAPKWVHDVFAGALKSTYLRIPRRRDTAAAGNGGAALTHAAIGQGWTR